MEVLFNNIIVYVATWFYHMSANTTNMGLIWFKFVLFHLAFTEPLDDRRISCLKQSIIISFVIPPAHDMEFWDFKMLIMLKFHLFISRLLEFLFCVLSSSHSNSESHSYNFLKFHESMTRRMRICLLCASPILPISHNPL